MTGTQEKLSIQEAIASDAFTSVRSQLSFVLGTNERGEIQTDDLEIISHLAVAGVNGTGKSRFIHSLLLSIISHASPQEVQLLLCDTMITEYSFYNDLPHTMVIPWPNLYNIRDALQWACDEIERRCRCLYGPARASMPEILVVVDDAYLVMEFKEVEEYLQRILLNGRTAGVHLILVTSTPKERGLNKIIQHISARAVFNLYSKTDLKFMLDTSHLPKIPPLEAGTMVYKSTMSHAMGVISCCQIEDEDIREIILQVRERYPNETRKVIPEYLPPNEHFRSIQDPEPGDIELEGDEVLLAAVEVILETKQASVSMLQRRLKLGYARAARIVDEMEEKGIVGPFMGSKPRQILITQEDWECMRNSRPAQECPPEDDLEAMLPLELDGFPEDRPALTPPWKTTVQPAAQPQPMIFLPVNQGNIRKGVSFHG